MADRPIPARSEVPEESTWNLRDVFESDEAWQAEYEALKAVPEQIEAFRGRLGESAETLLEWFRLNDALSVRLEKLYGYANCKGARGHRQQRLSGHARQGACDARRHRRGERV